MDSQITPPPINIYITAPKTRPTGSNGGPSNTNTTATTNTEGARTRAGIYEATAGGGGGLRRIRLKLI
ncbi:hypothetical protein E2C01_059075 [Portunus trituberculatus]|uniref:Uncharacterized protein n=1 Tax=Portunus trituberculatus TaxID=210409 RepID=A0A5B7H4E5_PORTR|nr:hypothetical protein [Portunus trituberculatus]